MGNIKSKAFTTLCVILLLFVAYNYVRIAVRWTGWIIIPEGEALVFSKVDDKKLLTFAFMPDHKLISIYFDGNNICHQLGEIRGTYSNKVVWRIYYNIQPVKGSSFSLSEEGYKPVAFEYMALVNSVDSCDVFPKLGSTTYFLSQFNKNSMIFSGTKFKQDENIAFEGLKQIQKDLENMIKK